MLLKLLPLALFLAIAGFLWRGLSLDPGKLPSPLIDRPAPVFTVATLPRPEAEAGRAKGVVAASSGAVFDSEAMTGRVWLLNVWASWCGPCAQEHPQFVALNRQRDVPIVGLNYKDDPDAARAWLSRHGDIFSDVLSDVEGSVGLDWGVYGVPETFVIDAAGQVRYKHVGPVLPNDLEETLLPIIDELTDSPT